ncbi:hypothetical protein D3C78_1209410 [compost metagenome]
MVAQQLVEQARHATSLFRPFWPCSFPALVERHSRVSQQGPFTKVVSVRINGAETINDSIDFAAWKTGSHSDFCHGATVNVQFHRQPFAGENRPLFLRDGRWLDAWPSAVLNCLRNANTLHSDALADHRVCRVGVVCSISRVTRPSIDSWINAAMRWVGGSTGLACSISPKVPDCASLT